MICIENIMTSTAKSADYLGNVGIVGVVLQQASGRRMKDHHSPFAGQPCGPLKDIRVIDGDSDEPAR
jgi:hypothetical protein